MMRGLTAEETLFAANFANLHEFVEFATGVAQAREKPGSWPREKPGFSKKPGFFGGASPSVGRADAALLELRAATFGPVLPCVTDCPACGEALEFDASVAALLTQTAAEQAAYRWAGLDAEVEYRLATSEDLAAIAGAADLGSAESALFARLVLSAAVFGRPAPASELPAEVVQAVAEDMAGHDPQAETVLALTCPACRHAWTAALDIATFFRAELAAEARRLLGEVHALARAYGWSERDILALSPARRRAYLDLVLGT